MSNAAPRKEDVARRIKDQRSPSPRGFTLVELLVVVSIIALLMGILVPTLGAARRKGQQAACASNLRQIGGAALLRANDRDGEMCSGPFDNRQRNSRGPIDEYGWVADDIKGEYCVPGNLLCPGNLSQFSQNIGMARLRERPWKAYTAQQQTELINRGFNTNYTQAWAMAYTGMKNHFNPYSDPALLVRVQGGRTLPGDVVGGLNTKYLGAAASPSLVVLMADGRTDATNLAEVDGKQERAVKALTDGPVSSLDRWGMQDYDDLGPAHGKGSLIRSLTKRHDRTIGNFLFADDHVDSIEDTNHDGEFGATASQDDEGRLEYHELQGRVFGGWLSQPGPYQ